jgi:hypothetical protein
MPPLAGDFLPPPGVPDTLTRLSQQVILHLAMTLWSQPMRAIPRTVSLLFLMTTLATLTFGEEKKREPSRDLLTIENLPRLRSGIQTHQFCTYDRAGDNYDWDYFELYFEPNGELVLFDAMGPGCLSRQQMNVWMSAATYKTDTTDVRIRYYFDDEEKPRVDMDISTFFSEKNPLEIFREPLSVNGGDDFRIMYCPMHFQKRLKITLNREPGGPRDNQTPWPGRFDKVPAPRSHWCHFTYHTYTEDPGIPSWTPGEVATGLAAQWDAKKMGQDPKSTEGNKPTDKEISLGTGKKATLAEFDEAGSIASVRVSLEPLTEETLFNTWIKMTWDGAALPQVEAPLGLFFGGYQKAIDGSCSSLLVGCSPKSMYCYFPMPFWKSAKIELENRGKQDVKSLAASIQFTPAAVRGYPEKECGYFYAHYSREYPRTEGHDYTYLKWNGRGHIIGQTIARFDTCMEESERTYFDGSLTPSIHGNGFEDDHNMGWGLKNRQHAVFGAMAAFEGAGGVYRLFLPDVYYFQSSVKHGHQTYGPNSPRGHEGMYVVGNEESVDFFYGRETPDIVLTDELDVGRRDSESAHAYRVDGERRDLSGKYWYDGEMNNVLFPVPAIEDDGVSFAGSSEFKLKIDPENHGVRLRRRLDKSVNRQQANVYVDGQRVTERPWYTVDHYRTFRGIRWVDSDFEIPAKYTAGKGEIVVRIDSVGGPDRPWNEFHYWVYSYQP